MKTPLKPNAKFDNLVVQEFSDEILIYNLENNKAYSLNRTSKLVWENCDGTKDVSQIANEMAKYLKQEVPDELVWLALDKLTKDGLVEANDEMTTVLSGFNRREILKRVGLTTMVALPLIASIIAPIAANAQSAETCTGCIVGLGIVDGVPQGVCPAACKELVCKCYGNNSCPGQGQLSPFTTCEDCREAGNAKNNAWQCDPIILVQPNN